jgi:hypothetical protein
MILPNTALDSLLNITVHQQAQDMLTKSQDTKENHSLADMKMELLMETSLLPFIETLLLSAEKEEDMICKDLTIGLVKTFQEQLIS